MSDERDKSLNAAREALKKAESADGDAERDAARAKSSQPEDALHPLARLIPGGPAAAKALGVLDVLWNRWAKPFARLLNPLARRVWRFYGWSYERFAYIGSERAGGERRFSRERAAVVTLALAAITLAAPIVLVRYVIPATMATIYDAVMLASIKEERLYLGRAELIRPDDQVYQVMGCRDISGCDGGENTTYFRLRDNIILDIRNWTTRLTPYDPAEIAGAMLSELNDCTIRYYGRRWKALGWYPYIISASCTPV